MTDKHSEIQPTTGQGTGATDSTESTESKEMVAQPASSVDALNPFSESQSLSSQERGDAKGEEEQSQEYKLKFPDIVSSDVADIHTNNFKEAGVEADKAQKVIDALAHYEEQAYERHIEGLKKSLEEDKRVLQQELGSDYDTRVKDISRYFYEENISDSDVQSLVTEWGFQKTFQFFDRYAQMSKESSAGDTFARNEGVTSTATDTIFSDPKFIKKIENQDSEALGKIRAWALQQAQLEQ